MTISSTTRVAGPFTGSGTTATFPFSFKAFEATDLYVATLNVATGAITTLALTTDYSVSLNADQDSSPGGSITLTAGNLATGMTLTITTAIAQLQGLDLTNGGAFYPDVINAALDLLTILLQQLAAPISRSLQLPLVDGSMNVTLPAAATRAGAMLAFDGGGNMAMVQLYPDQFVCGGPTTSFGLSKAPFLGRLLQVTLNGLAQPETSYSAAGATLNVTFATEEGDIVNAIYLA